MAKKGAKKTSTKKKATSKKPRAKKATTSKTKRDTENQRILLENFVNLQSVMATLSSRLNDLTEKISKMLDLFESSAKAITEKDGIISEIGQGKDVSEKLNKLLDQNKVLAQGIALLHESNQNQFPEMGNQELGRGEMPQSGPPPSMAPPSAGQIQNQNPSRYQRSISSKY